VLGPGENDVLAFVKSDRAGQPGGISHFGFRLKNESDMEQAFETAKAAGADIMSSGEFAPGCPYHYVLDPDGYEIEIWFE
jgi:catechol 2,3-dioxygenase-like lactoylglutathione lyase family enzyme